MGLGDMGCAKTWIPKNQRITTAKWPIGGSVGGSSDASGVGPNYTASNCAGMFIEHVAGPPIGRGPAPGELKLATPMQYFAYVTDKITTKAACEKTFIEVAGYSYLKSKLEQFWRLDGVTKKHGVWKHGHATFEFDDGSGSLWARDFSFTDKGTEEGSVEVGAHVATANIAYFRTAARAYTIGAFGVRVPRNVWAGVHPKCPCNH